MVTLAILAILVALAAPSMMRTIERQAVASAMQSLVSDLRLARSESLKRGVMVAVCGSSGPPHHNCLSGAGSRTDWTAQGWVVHELNADNTGAVIKVGQRSLAIGRIRASKASIPFLPTGIQQGIAANIQIAAPDTTDASLTQTACISTTGRARIITGRAPC